MKHIKARINHQVIDIYLGSNLNDLIVKTLYKTRDKNQFIVSKTVYSRVKDMVQHLSEKAPIIIGFKEKGKSLKSFKSLLKQCYERSLNRESQIIGIGGGMMGDYVGFLAASYMRGVKFIYIPTTLMSQCDVVVNKVALNVNGIKNLIGSFYSPTVIFCDISYIKTLPQSMISYGMIEIVKHALIKPSKLLRILKDYSKKNKKRKNYKWEEIIYESLKTKVSLIKKDPFDTKGIQKGLNYGHTFAHALEDYTSYDYPHGHAVGIGLKIAGHVSNQLRLLSSKDLNMQNKLLELSKLDLSLPADFNTDKFIPLLKRHKRSENKISLILLKKLGKYAMYNQIDEELIIRAINKHKLPK